MADQKGEKARKRWGKSKTKEITKSTDYRDGRRGQREEGRVTKKEEEKRRKGKVDDLSSLLQSIN